MIRKCIEAIPLDFFRWGSPVSDRGRNHFPIRGDVVQTPWSRLPNAGSDFEPVPKSAPPQAVGSVMPSLTLLRQSHTLADPREQVRVLERGDSLARFDSTLAQYGLTPLAATSLDVLQVNVGRLCNQTCRHCHVDAGPDRREIMSSAVMQGCLDVLQRHPFSTLDSPISIPFAAR